MIPFDITIYIGLIGFVAGALFVLALVPWFTHRAIVRRRLSSSAYFHKRADPIPYTPSWDRVAAARRVK